jgi:phage baseplate assembly protein W
LCGTRQKLAQAVDQFFQGKSGGSGTRREFSCHLAELTFALDSLPLRLLIADKSPGALMGFEQAPEFQFAVGAHHGVGIDGEIDGELADSGKLIPGRQGARGYTGPHLIDELAINRDASMKIKSEGEASVLKILSHAH